MKPPDGTFSNQRAAFADFIRESNDTLSTFKLLLRLALVLLLALAAVLVVLAYRGMIAPLRHQLSETHAILMRQEKLASLGVLAAGVAHEIRNPLTAIKFRLYSLKKVCPPPPATTKTPPSSATNSRASNGSCRTSFSSRGRPSRNWWSYRHGGFSTKCVSYWKCS